MQTPHGRPAAPEGARGGSDCAPSRAHQSGKRNACKEIFLGIFMPQYGDRRRYAHHVAQCKTCEDAITGRLPTVFGGVVPFLFAWAKRVEGRAMAAVRGTPSWLNNCRCTGTFGIDCSAPR